MRDSSVEQEHRYRAVVESQVEMVCRFRRDGTILFANTAYAAARGTTAEALAGANFWAFIPELEHAGVAALLDSLSVEHPEVRIENRFDTTEGVRWTMWTNRALLFDESGRAIEFQSSGLDITDRKRAEEALRDSEGRYRHIFETAGVSIWDEDFSAVKRAIDDLKSSGVTDVSAYLQEHPEWVDRAITLVRIREVNPATLRLFEAGDQSELLGSLHTTFLPETRAVFADELIAIADGRTNFQAETVVRTMTGAERNVLLTIVFPASGSFGSVLVTLTDITERKQVEAHLRETAEALEESNRMKDEFLATLSHELRTPLNAVVGWAHMLRSGALSAGVAERALASIERNARAQSQLIDDLLDMSRIVSGRLQIDSDIVALSQVVAAAADTVRPAASSKGVELQVIDNAHDGAWVRGDADRLRQVLWNLLVNGIKFTPGGGRVQVELRVQNQWVEVVVHDSGEGIAPDFLPHVFDRFRQADATSTRRHGGLGLGLSIAHHLAEAHGGRLIAQSDGRNRGATFTLQLPRVMPAGHSRPATPSASVETPLAGTAIVVVDDDADESELLRVALEMAGAEVTVRSTAPDALRHLRSHPVDLLIADVGMASDSGIALMRAVRSLPAPLGQLPAIAVTTHSALDEKARAFEAGFNAHVTKPLEVDRLLGAVLDTLQRRRRLPIRQSTS